MKSGFRVNFLSLTLLVSQQALDLPAIALAQARRAGLPARALTPICFFNHAMSRIMKVLNIQSRFIILLSFKDTTQAYYESRPDLNLFSSLIIEVFVHTAVDLPVPFKTASLSPCRWRRGSPSWICP